MTKRQTKYIVKRNYDNRRTDTEAFLRLIKKSSKSSKLSKNSEIEYNKYNIDSNRKECYNKNSFRESCVISENSNKEE
ncbi:hypothetical protein [Peptoniphilus sp. HCN-40583]|uniref:hypothetical protein n=1 Tax=Peptoniphilus sp. HCN-40583 TaxID=3134662 RepID=UPI0030BC1BCA